MHLHHNFLTNIPVYVLQDPAMSGMISNLTNPAHKEQLEQRMAQVREDPALKPVLEEIEGGGPAAMMKWMTLLLKSTHFLSLCFCCILDIFVAFHALPDRIKSLLSKVLGCKQCSIYSFYFITYWFPFLSLHFFFVFFSFICVPFPPLLLSGGKDSYVECGAWNFHELLTYFSEVSPPLLGFFFCTSQCCVSASCYWQC